MLRDGPDLYIGAPRDKGGVSVLSWQGMLLLALPGWRKLRVYW